MYVNLSVDQKFKDMACLRVRFSLCSAVHGCHYFQRIVTITICSSNQSYSALPCACISPTTPISASVTEQTARLAAWLPQKAPTMIASSFHEEAQTSMDKTQTLHSLAKSSSLLFLHVTRNNVPAGPNPGICTPQEKAACIIMSHVKGYQ